MNSAPNIDLSFQAPVNLFGEMTVDMQAIKILSDSHTWEKYLIAWIHYIRSSKSFLCPEVLRTVKTVTMGLRFTDDETIASLNSSWRNKTGSTDVLSFPALDCQSINCDKTCVEIGDIIVSTETAARQAKEYGHSLTYELKWLVSHGFLHLLGWDHPTDESLNEMLSFQEQLLSNTGNIHHS